MRIVIDMQGAQTLASKNRGVGRYTRELTMALIKKCCADEVFLVLNGEYKSSCDELIQFFKDVLPREHIKVWDWYAGVPKGHSRTDINIQRAENIFYEWYFQQFNADVIWRPNLQEGLFEENVILSANCIPNNAFVCTTLHDVTPLLFPDDYLDEYVEPWYRSKLQYAVQSDYIITGSEFAKKKIKEFLAVDEEKIVTILDGYDRDKFYPNSDYLKYTQKQPFVFYAGGADKHKNLEYLMKAFSLLPAEILDKYELVLAGKEPLQNAESLYLLADEIGLSREKVKFLGYIDDFELLRTMQMCSAFVFPSVSEGFGLPVLEAMACGAPVLAARATSLAEIVNDEELLFDPYVPEDCANKLHRLLRDETFTNKKINELLEQTKRFSWDIAGDQLYQFFSKITLNPKNQISQYSVDQLCADIGHLCVDKDLYYKANIARSIGDSILFQNQKHIYIDCSGVVQVDVVTGIQRVVNAIIANAIEIFAENENIKVVPVYSPIDKPVFYKAAFNGKKYVRNVNEGNNNIIEFRDGDYILLADLDPGMIMQKEEYLVGLKRRGINVFTLLYDLIPIEFPTFYNENFVNAFAGYLKSMSKFTGVIAISNAVLDTYKKWLKTECIPEDMELEFAHLGADIDKANPSKGLPENYQDVLTAFEERPTFLMVSTIEPRKRQEEIVTAVENLWAQNIDINLCLVGRNGWMMDAFVKKLRTHDELGKRLFWLEGVSDEYLELVYNASTAVIIASIQEGFGLPIVEAAMHQKPVILRDIPVFREIAQDGAFYFKGTTIEEISERLKEWLTLYGDGCHPSSKGIQVLSWKQATINLLQKMGVLVE